MNRRSAGRLAIVAILLPVLSLCGCGQKGPLYLPGNPSEIKTEVPKQENAREIGQEMPASEQQDDEEDPENQPE